MAQYTTITLSETLTLDDGTDTFRLQVTGTEMFIDQYRGGSWQNIDSFQLPTDPSTVFRVGARDGEWRIDQIYDASPLGWSGLQGFDWDCISSYTL